MFVRVGNDDAVFSVTGIIDDTVFCRTKETPYRVGACSGVVGEVGGGIFVSAAKVDSIFASGGCEVRFPL